jgi:hypothetical protein
MSSFVVAVTMIAVGITVVHHRRDWVIMNMRGVLWLQGADNLATTIRFTNCRSTVLHKNTFTSQIINDVALLTLITKSNIR